MLPRQMISGRFSVRSIKIKPIKINKIEGKKMKNWIINCLGLFGVFCVISVFLSTGAYYSSIEELIVALTPWLVLVGISIWLEHKEKQKRMIAENETTSI